jgi:pyruvate-ferredoxin/flavodoxin oxidoreductase
MRNETRFRVVEQQNPERFRKLLEQAQNEIRTRRALYEELARGAAPAPKAPAAPAPATPTPTPASQTH